MPDSNGNKMTKAERDDLARLVRRREKLAKSAATARAAELTADFEAQLARQYDPLDEAWRDLYEEAEQAVKALNRRIAEKSEERGIPPQLAPSAGMGWLSRGENYTAQRRVELRKVAQTRIAAAEKAAKAEIEGRSVELQTRLIAGGLESAEARDFLESMPTAEALMPALSVPEIERSSGGGGRG